MPTFKLKNMADKNVVNPHFFSCYKRKMFFMCYTNLNWSDMYDKTR